MIHSSAIIHPKADIGTDVDIGPYAVIGEHVAIGHRTVIGPHVVIEPFVEIGEDCRISSHAAIGGFPQSMGFKGEETHVRIGRGTVIREFVTINRGTQSGGGITEIGEECYFLAYAHVGHDCTVGHHTILTNCATLGGHVTVGHHVNLSAMVAVHQYARVGDYVMVGGVSGVAQDIPPYAQAQGDRAKLYGLNTIGLKRAGFTEETLSLLKKAYRILFRSGLTMKKAIEKIEAELDPIPEVKTLVDFVTSSKRGIAR